DAVNVLIDTAIGAGIDIIVARIDDDFPDGQAAKHGARQSAGTAAAGDIDGRRGRVAETGVGNLNAGDDAFGHAGNGRGARAAAAGNGHGGPPEVAGAAIVNRGPNDASARGQAGADVRPRLAGVRALVNPSGIDIADGAADGCVDDVAIARIDGDVG